MIYRVIGHPLNTIDNGNPRACMFHVKSMDREIISKAWVGGLRGSMMQIPLNSTRSATAIEVIQYVLKLCSNKCMRQNQERGLRLIAMYINKQRIY